jgi:CDP-glucose 4,6-dehydratase
MGAAYLLLAEQLASRPELRGQAFNFSNESPLTVSELVALILTLMGSDLQPQILNEASNEIRSQYLNSARARAVLGWRPGFTLDNGLSETVRWYEKFFLPDAQDS